MGLDLSDSLNKHVLLVDDFANVRKSIKSMITSIGLRNVFEAAHGNEATRIVREQKLDIVMCDYNLEKGKNGSQLLEEWRKRGWLSHETFFVMITAETSRDRVMGTLEFQPDDYLAKPFALDTLKQRLVRWMDRQEELRPVNAALDRGNWEEVAKMCRDLIKNKSRYRSWAQRKYHQALLKTDRLEDATKFLGMVLKEREYPWARLEVHRIQVARKELPKAEKGLRTLINKEPNLIDAYDLLAQVQNMLKQPEHVQHTLEQALERSPLSIPRQRSLAKVATGNGDLATATRAYKEVVNLSEGTMHDSPDVYKDALRATRTRMALETNEAQRRRLRLDAMTYLKKLMKNFPDDADGDLVSRAYRAFLNDPQDVRARADGFIKELAQKASRKMEELSQDSAVDIAEIIYEKGENELADELIDKLRDYHRSSKSFLERLNQVQTEPKTTSEMREKAHHLNIQGIEHYKKKRYTEAVGQFEEALEHSPRHPGIILNLVQSSLLEVGAGTPSKQRLDQCVELIKRISYLPRDHYQYDRYLTIRTKLNDLTNGAVVTQ